MKYFLLWQIITRLCPLFHLHHVDNFLFIETRSEELICDPVLHLNWKSVLKYLLIPSVSSHLANFIARLRPPCQPD